MDVGDSKKRIFLLFVLSTFLMISLSGCVTLKCSYVPNDFLVNGWYENTSLRNTGLHLLGLEKWCNIIYEIKGKYPASLIVTSLKAIFLEDENELYDIVKDMIKINFNDGILINESSKLSGERNNFNNHKTKYIIYEGIELEKDLDIKIIGEVWNCGNTGSSIICVGIAYISNRENPIIKNTINWEKIVEDPNGNIENYYGGEGLIYNIKCH